MKNLKVDMKHAHALDMHGKKVFSTNGVADERKSHGATSSTYRGQQLLSTVQGKRLEVASLCLLHDSENGVVPPGSVRVALIIYFNYQSYLAMPKFFVSIAQIIYTG